MAATFTALNAAITAKIIAATGLQSLAAAQAISIGVYAGMAAGIYGISQALTPSIRPEAQKQTIRQAVPARRRYYWLNKVGGYYGFLDDKDSRLYQLILINDGEIEEFVSHWLGEDQVTLDGSGNVTSPSRYQRNGVNYAKIETKLGTTDQTAFSTLTSAFPEWTTDHRLRGIACSLITLLSPPAESFTKIYPGGLPQYNAVIKAGKIFDPRDDGQSIDDPTTWVASPNGALIVMDYLWHQKGMRIPRAMIEPALAEWAAQADICDEDVDLKAGGTELRYRLAGGYEETSAPKSVIPGMLMPMDARLFLRTDGSICIDVGRYVTPTVTLTDDHVLSYELARGLEPDDIRNEIRAKFVSPDYNYEEQEADPWRDEDSISALGVQSDTLDLGWCPSHAQARRRQKVEAYRKNPAWSGSITTNAYGLRCIDQRFVRIQIAEISVDEVFEILKWGPFDATTGQVQMQVSSMPEEAYAWNAAAEEGTAPVASDAPEGTDIEEPAALNTSVGGSVITADVTAPTQASLVVEMEYRVHDGLVTDDDAIWTALSINQSTWTGQTGSLPADDYDVRARFVAPDGTESDWVYDRSITVT